MVPEAFDVNNDGVSPEQIVCAPLILPAEMSFTVTVIVSSLKQPEALKNLTVTELPLEMVEIVVVYV